MLMLYAPFSPSDRTPKPYSQMAAIGNMVAVFYETETG